MNGKKLVGLVAIALMALLIATTVVSAEDGTPTPGYDVYGYVRLAPGDFAPGDFAPGDFDPGNFTVFRATVRLINIRTGETLTDVTDSLGRFQFYLSDLTLGYNENDTFSVYAEMGSYSGTNTTEVNLTAGSSRIDIYIKTLTVTTGWGTSYDLYITVAIVLVVALLGVVAFFFIMSRRRLGKR